MNSFNGIFWGIVLIMAGLLFLIKNYINIDIPVFKLLFGIVLIYWGLQIIVGGFHNNEKHHVVFNNKKQSIKIDKNTHEHNIVFGSGTIDFSDIEQIDENVVYEINVVFGNAVIKIPKEIDYSLRLNTAFGSVKTPDKNTGMFANEELEKETGKKKINLEINTVFGETKIIN